MAKRVTDTSSMANLFDLAEFDPRATVVPNDDWRPEAPPSLDGETTVYFNFETDGLRWFEKDRPIALSIYARDRSWYLPFKHPGGGNLSEEQVYRFSQQELRGKHLININTRFDIHMGREWGRNLGSGGLDFEEMGCTVSDVSHYAALLDDHRIYMNLDSLIRDYLHEQPMVRLDESRMASYSAGAAQARARYNVEAVKRLRDVFWPMMDEQSLQRVRQLEDEVIFVVCEMEKNGSKINVPLLDKWIFESRKQYHQALMDLLKLTGLKINPNSSPDTRKLFEHYRLPINEFSATGLASFTKESLKVNEHPAVKLLFRAKKLGSLNSKLEKYKTKMCSDGTMRYALHQLRTDKGEGGEGGETGTVTGRFTSTAIVEGVGINIQQVMKPEKQFREFGDEFFIRELHIPDKGWLHLSSDAEQIQYRLFAHEANNAEIIKAYKENPWLSYHRMTLEKFRVFKPDLEYGKCKDVNFAKMFEAGPTKLALMLGFITKAEYEELKVAKVNRHHPKLAGVKEILKIYDEAIPEVSILSKEAQSLALNRGYVKTILGRRMRFPNGWRIHKALNGRIQGSEADYVKTKAVELHKARKFTGLKLQFQVHDEFDGMIPEPECAKKVSEILNAQAFDLRVPILWGTKTGNSWGDCAREEIKKLRKEMNG